MAVMLPSRIPRTGSRHKTLRSRRHHERADLVCAGCGRTGPLVERHGARWCPECDPRTLPPASAPEEDAA